MLDYWQHEGFRVHYLRPTSMDMKCNDFESYAVSKIRIGFVRESSINRQGFDKDSLSDPM